VTRYNISNYAGRTVDSRLVRSEKLKNEPNNVNNTQVFLVLDNERDKAGW
jgi:hypothetical protein